MHRDAASTPPPARSFYSALSRDARPLHERAGKPETVWRAGLPVRDHVADQRATAPRLDAAVALPRINPSNREPTAKSGSAAPFKRSRTDPLNREPMARPGPTAP